MYGARQVGKTTLSKVIAQEFSLEDCKYIDCDILSNRQSLSVQDPNSLKRFIGNYRVVVIDEAQRIANVGIILKILHNYMPDTQFIATGSSSFDLSNKISEPLTGRSKEFLITPFSAFELQNKHEI